MNKDEINLLEKINDLPLVSGFEKHYIKEFKEIVEKYIGKKVKVIDDNIVFKSNKDVVFVAHYDEIGFIVDNQYSKRLYRTLPIGLISYERGYGKIFQTKLNGKTIKAIGSSVLPHEETDEKRLFLEFLEDVEIPPLWPFTFEKRVIESKDYIYSRALDNRAGVIALLSLAKNHNISFVLSAGEEQGTNRFSNLISYFGDINYVVVDSFTAFDDVHINSGLKENEIGYIPIEGAGVGNIAPKDLLEKVRKKLDKEIKTHSKYEVTDATSFYRLNAKSIAIGYPLKYLHSSFEILNKKTFIRLKEKIITLNHLF